jgi:ketol-acid reductoisomerase
VEIYLRDPSKAPGARPLAALAVELEHGARVAMLCSDAAIAPVYERYLRAVDRPLELILAHGFAVYSGALAGLAPGHSVSLLAPKAIGPQIVSHYRAGVPHALRAAVHGGPGSAVRELARAMGFVHLIETDFAKETVGDLVSEQGLLCGGLFALLDWTQAAMREAGVPEALIREECLTELELVAGLLKARGPAETFATISDAAKVGALLVRGDFEASDLRARLCARFGEIVDGRFAGRFLEKDWQPAISDQIRELRQKWQETNP